MGIERRLAKLPANSLHRTHPDTSIEIEDPTHAITLASAGLNLYAVAAASSTTTFVPVLGRKGK
jgi:hypothetical protein